MTHSPLPWKHDDRWITDAYGKDVAQGYTQSPFDNEADAILTVTAVNAHATLVAALEKCIKWIEASTRVHDDEYGYYDTLEERIDANAMPDEWIEALAALELARKGGA